MFSSVEMVRDKFGIKEGTRTMGCWVRLEIVSNGWLVLLDEEMVQDKFGIKEGTRTMGCWVRLEIVSNGWLVLLDEEMVQRSEEY